MAAICAEPPADTAALRHLLATRFTAEPLGTGLLTGYFEPEIAGSPTPNGAHPTPLRGRPPDLVEVDLGPFLPDLAGRRTAGRVVAGRLEPYPDRAAIQAGALAGLAPELAFVDPVEAFILQIQGSGRVRFPDGSVLRLGYAGQNGHRYVPIGRVLVAEGAMSLAEVTMPAIRAWMGAAGPAASTRLMNANPSYVFFRPLDLPAELGPIGTQGVPLTPMRSLAVDRTQVPLGLPVWIEGIDPLTGAPLRRLTLAQDTGGAIRGAARGDLFTGWGAEAEARAGRLRDPARFWLLRPKP
jgi:membrane-bound lytic murein transglycosylase A